MSEYASDVQVLSAALIEHARERAGEHPGTETLVEYLTGGLAGDAEERVRDHLVGCRSCTAQLLELEPLARPEVPREGVADLATAAAWREVKGRLWPAARPAVGWQWPHAVAAAALVAAVGLSGWVAQLRGTVAELTEPQANLPLAYLGEVVRSDGEETIEWPAGAARHGVIFSSPELGDAGDFERYEVRFFDTDGVEVLHVDGLVLSDSLTLRLGLVRGNLPAGRYRVEVSGFDGDRWQPLEEHWRRIVYQEEP